MLPLAPILSWSILPIWSSNQAFSSSTRWTQYSTTTQLGHIRTLMTMMQAFFS
jgi:hypothetical protein